MPTSIQVLLLSLMPAAGNSIGGIGAEFDRVRRGTLAGHA